MAEVGGEVGGGVGWDGGEGRGGVGCVWGGGGEAGHTHTRRSTHKVVCDHHRSLVI